MKQDEMTDNTDINEDYNSSDSRRNILYHWPTLLVIVTFLLGIYGGYFAWGRSQQVNGETSDTLAIQTKEEASNTSPIQPQIPENTSTAFDMTALMEQVNPTDGFNLGISYGNLGPQVVAAGGIDYPAFVSLYETSGRPLTDSQLEILTRVTDEQIVINAENAHFLLNLFWAIGLINENPILTEGPITQRSEGQIERFASTGGWTLGTKPVTELFASQALITLAPKQQTRLEEAAALIYRPCCNNPTLFPDCNHGMAMLGLLELMASNGASVDEMLGAAKYVNAFWFPQQALETAIFLETSQGKSFKDADAALVVGKEMMSGSGFGSVHQYLQTNGLLAQMPGSGSSCAN